MPTQAYMKVMPHQRLAPISELDAEGLETLKVGEVVRAEIYKPRNVRNHRRFFAMLKLAHSFEQISDVYLQLEQFRKALLIAAGHVRWFAGYDPRTGAPVEWADAQSINFGSLDEPQFRKLFSDCIDALLRHFLVGQDTEELEQQFYQILDFA